MRKLISAGALLLILTACAHYKVVQLPLREADLYPLAQTRVGITVAIDEITNPESLEKYFGVDLAREGLFAINIVVSNHGEHRSTIKPSDVLLVRHKEVIDPLPVEMVAEIAKKHLWFTTTKTSKQIDEFFSSVALREMVLTPNESYHGVLFFKAIKSRDREDRFFTITRLFRGGDLKIRVAITDLETNDRIHFGPFSLSSIYRDIF